MCVETDEFDKDQYQILSRRTVEIFSDKLSELCRQNMGDNVL